MPGNDETRNLLARVMRAVNETMDTTMRAQGVNQYAFAMIISTPDEQGEVHHRTAWGIAHPSAPREIPSEESSPSTSMEQAHLNAMRVYIRYGDDSLRRLAISTCYTLAADAGDLLRAIRNGLKTCVVEGVVLNDDEIHNLGVLDEIYASAVNVASTTTLNPTRTRAETTEPDACAPPTNDP